MSAYNSTSRLSRSVESFNHDGLELARRRKRRRGFPVGQIVLFAVFVLAFKVFLVVQMGPAAYGAKMNALAEGGTMERLAARAMVLDPVSELVVEELRKILP